MTCIFTKRYETGLFLLWPGVRKEINCQVSLVDARRGQEDCELEVSLDYTVRLSERKGGSWEGRGRKGREERKEEVKKEGRKEGKEGEEKRKEGRVRREERGKRRRKGEEEERRGPPITPVPLHPWGQALFVLLWLCKIDKVEKHSVHPLVYTDLIELLPGKNKPENWRWHPLTCLLGFPTQPRERNTSSVGVRKGRLSDSWLGNCQNEWRKPKNYWLLQTLN